MSMEFPSIGASGPPARAPARAEPEAPARPETPSVTEGQDQGETQHDQAAMQALVRSLRGDFAEAGIVPPPRKFAGVDIATTGKGTQADSAQQRYGTLDRMKIIMVKNMLARLAKEAGTPSAPDGDVASSPEGQAAIDMML